MKRIKFDEETISKIREFIQEGHTIKETCNRFTIKRDTLQRVMFENGIEPYYERKSNKKVVDEELIQLVCGLYSATNMRMQDIVNETKLKNYVVQEILKAHFTEEYRSKRKAKLYAESKMGDKNPMAGLCGESHQCYKGVVSDCKGYVMILKPDWYTGRKGSKRVFYHSVVMCEALGLTEIPKGFVVHHIDGNKLNNNIDNLALVTISGHSRIHAIYRKLCKVQRLSEME